jgi:BrnA antitoxin of type II toxin-antitoxin system
MKDKYDFSQARRGAIDPAPRGTTRITIPLDDEILDWFRQQVHSAGGGNYLTLINKALREYVKNRKEPLEESMRRVVPKELSSPRGARKKGKRLPERKAS